MATLPIRLFVCGVGIQPGDDGDLGTSHWKLSRSFSFNLGLGPESVQWFLSESTLPFSLPIILPSSSLSLGPADSGPFLFPCAFPTVAVSLGGQKEMTQPSAETTLPQTGRVSPRPGDKDRWGQLLYLQRWLAIGELLTTLPLNSVSGHQRVKGKRPA